MFGRTVFAPWCDQGYMLDKRDILTYFEGIQTPELGNQANA
jgi:hypothetical protein